MPITGVVGQLKWAYYMAGAINGYTVARVNATTWTLAGTLVTADPFKMSQRPLVFVAPHQGGEWRWVVQELVVHGAQVSATLGRLEAVKA
jgi:hypothetical protein